MTVTNKRADAIRWIQAEMDEYGMTMEELKAAGCFDPPPPPPPPTVCYRNAEGLAWDGQGEMPAWGDFRIRNFLHDKRLHGAPGSLANLRQSCSEASRQPGSLP